MFCGNCGVKLNDGAVFCQKCGAKVATGAMKQNIPTTLMMNSSMVTATTQNASVKEVPAKKGKGALIPLIAVLAVVMIIGIIVIIAFKIPNDEIENAGKENSEEVSELKEQELSEKSEASGGEAYNAIHRYELFVEDVTWTQAWHACKQKGGYLVHVNSQEEYDAITEQIFAEERQNIIFWLGAMRGSDSEEYRWVDANGAALDDVLNRNSIYDGFWMSGEPSFQGDDLQETCIDMFYRASEERFVWNDVPDDLIGVVSAYSGKVGYICEYED